MTPPYITLDNSVGTAHILVREIGNAGDQLGSHGQHQQGPDGDHGCNGGGQNGAGEVDNHSPCIVGSRNLHRHSQTKQGGGGVVHQGPAEKGQGKQQQEQSFAAHQHQREQGKEGTAQQHDGTGRDIADAQGEQAAA